MDEQTPTPSFGGIVIRCTVCDRVMENSMIAVDHGYGYVLWVTFTCDCGNQYQKSFVETS